MSQELYGTNKNSSLQPGHHSFLEHGNSSTAMGILEPSKEAAIPDKCEGQIMPVIENFRKGISAGWQHLPIENTLSSTMAEMPIYSEMSDHEHAGRLHRNEKMISVIRNCYFEPGEWTVADQLFENMIKDTGTIDYPLTVLSEIANTHLDDEHILEGVLHILSNYDYQEIDPIGISIAVACAYNHYAVIQDLLISCFEIWDSPKAISVLRKMDFENAWLSEYRDDVVELLRHKNISD